MEGVHGSGSGLGSTFLAYVVAHLLSKVLTKPGAKVLDLCVSAAMPYHRTGT